MEQKFIEQEERLKQAQIYYQNSVNWLRMFHKKAAEQSQQLLKEQLQESKLRAQELLNSSAIAQMQDRLAS